MMKKKLLFTALAAGMLGLLALALLARWSSPTFDPGSPLAQPATPGAPVSADLSKTASQPPSLPTLDANLPPAVRQLAALMASPVPLPDGGTTREFQLSTTEVSLRGPDGVSKIVPLPHADSPQSFAAALEKLRAEEGVEPDLVLYPVGFSQNEATRRIATREVVITAPSRSEADALAAANGLVFKKTPEFAPNSFVYEAPTSAKALSVQADPSTALEATPLLASHASRKTMPNDPYIQLQWHLKFQFQKDVVAGTDLQVESLWNYPSTSASNSIRGRGVVIGIVDDGMEWSHPDLTANVMPGLQWDWNGRDNDPMPLASHSHGTACAGVAAARGNNRIGVSGVAPEANLAGMRLIADNYTDLDVSEAMTWKMGDIHILSNSWGPFDYGYILEAPGDLTRAALKAAADFGRGGRGTIITFAGGNGRDTVPGALLGNDNSNYDGYANSIYTIAVAAMDCLGQQSSYSENGSNLVVTAPSDGGPLGIMTTDNTGRGGSNYGIFSLLPGSLIPGQFYGSADVSKLFGGTSSATPAVSGVIALMLEKKPTLGWRDVQEILMRSAIKINHTDPDWKTPVAPDFIHHNHKYGAGLVNATAAVALSANWTNLPPQTSALFSLPLATPQSIPGGNITTTRSFNVTDSLRAEHVTLAIKLPGVYKGNLRILLTSPAGTTSVLCEPHDDRAMFIDADGNPKGFVDADGSGVWDDAEPFVDLNNNGTWDIGEIFTDLNTNGRWDDEETLFDPNVFEDWTFMTVRNWGEPSNGFWKLTIENTGPDTGSLTEAKLTVFGTPATAASNALPVVNLEVSRAKAFVGTTLTLTANATDPDGSIAEVEFFADSGSGPVSIGKVTDAPFTRTFMPSTTGDLVFTARATDKGTPAASATSSPVRVQVDTKPIAAWDFDTATQSPTPLATALQSVRQYHANFGSNNATVAKVLVDGTQGSTLWSVANGEIWSGTGNATVNSLADSNPFAANAALQLRGGRNFATYTQDRSVVFQLDMTNARRLRISYAAAATLGGFTTHTWEYWDDDAKDWMPILDSGGNAQVSLAVPSTYTLITLDQAAGSGFNGRPNARIRLRVSGATAVSGTNLLDNIRFNATVAP